MAHVVAKRHAKTAHIQTLVQCQKKPSNRSRNRKHAKPKFIYPSEQSDLVFVNEQHRSNNVRLNNNNQYNRCHRTVWTSNISADNYIKKQQASVVSQQKLTKETNSLIKSFAKFPMANFDKSSSSAEQTNLEIYVAKDEIDMNPDEAQLAKHLDNQSRSNNNQIINNQNSRMEYISSDEGCDEDAIPTYAMVPKVLYVSLFTYLLNYIFI